MIIFKRHHIIDISMSDTGEEFEKQINKIIINALSTPYKIYQHVHVKEPRITLERVRTRFSENDERTKQVGGAKNNYVAQGPFQDYQADVFYITEKQMPNQEYPFGLSMIGVCSKYATVTHAKERKVANIMAAILPGFASIWKQPEVLFTRTCCRKV